MSVNKHKSFVVATREETEAMYTRELKQAINDVGLSTVDALRVIRVVADLVRHDRTIGDICDELKGMRRSA